MSQRKIYLAYGSNINQRQMAKRCPFARVMGTGYIEGQELQFKGVATVAPKENAVTPVLAWTLTRADEEMLDAYEGYPNIYIKKDFEVEIDGKSVTGMAYVMNKLRPQYIPTQSYFNCIEEGYRKAGLDVSYLKSALKRAMHEQESRVIYHIAYGSNINETQMAQRCPGSVPLAKASIPDYELQFKDYATIAPIENSNVPVLIWKLTPENELALDRYESYPNYYRKEFFDYKHGGQSDIAMAYVMNGNSPLFGCRGV